MKRLRWLTVLMAITLVIIIGFQVYWLVDNYNREKRAMQIRTEIAFQETVQQLQVAKLKLPEMFLRSSMPGKKERIFVDEETSVKTNLPVRSKRRMITTTEVTSKNAADTMSIRHTFNDQVFVVMRDSNGVIRRMRSDHPFDSSGKNKEIFLTTSDEKINLGSERRQIVSTINVLRNKLSDSLKRDTNIKTSFFLRTPNNSNKIVKTRTPLQIRKPADTNRHVLQLVRDSNNQALRVLYSVDSLQDTLQLPDITKAYSGTLKKQDINLPFTITRVPYSEFKNEEDLTDVTVGFANPVTYHLSLGNTGSYLFKKISLPILFSLFLVGVTIFSFLLLYRNLLRQQKLAILKNDFISNISHELKTPIATVGVAIEALKNFNAMHDPRKTKEYLDISSSELQRLGLLVDKVLKLSMFEKKEVELNREYFDVKQLTREVIDTMKLQFDKNKVIVSFITEGNDFIINADKLHITSVIYNLLDNALKYRNEDPLINVKLLDKQNEIELIVKDNGIGIEAEYQAKIFDKFFRVPTGNKHVVKGYGLGLSYVSHIIDQHKGKIHVESDLDKGSTFIIKLPRTDAKG